jgi:putative aldouronate transport system substrate-binding protein
MKKFLACILALVLIVPALVSCKPETTPEPTGSASSTSQEEIVNTPLYKMDPAVELSVIKPADAFFGYTEEQTVSKNVVYEIWERAMGIKFVNKIETSSEAYDQQVKLAILSNDLPDVIGTSAADIDEMIKNDMIVDLAPYIAKYMDPTVAAKLNAFDGALYDAVRRGDKIYGIPATSNVEGSLRTMWIRKDWLEKVGKEVPKTMEEVIELAISFTKDDPDGNGKNDTWGLPIDKDITSSLLNTYEIVANAYGYYPTKRLQDTNGKFILGSMDPGLKDVVKIFSDLFEAGAIDPEFTSKNFMQVDEGVAAAKYGLWLGVFWKPVDPGFQTTYKEGVEWIAAPIPGSSTVGGVYKPMVNMPVGAYYAIRKGYENPEALIVAVNQYLQTDTKIEGGFIEEGKKLRLSHPELTGIPINNWAALQWQDPLYFDSSPLKKALADPDFDPENPQYTVHGQAYDIISGRNGSEDWVVRQFSDIFLESCAVHESYPTENYVFDAYFGAPTETMASKGSILTDLEVETLTKIIVGDYELSKYDEFITEYLELGGTQILAELNATLE